MYVVLPLGRTLAGFEHACLAHSIACFGRFRPTPPWETMKGLLWASTAGSRQRRFGGVQAPGLRARTPDRSGPRAL